MNKRSLSVTYSAGGSSGGVVKPSSPLRSNSSGSVSNFSISNSKQNVTTSNKGLLLSTTILLALLYYITKIYFDVVESNDSYQTTSFSENQDKEKIALLTVYSTNTSIKADDTIYGRYKKYPTCDVSSSLFLHFF